MPHQFQLALTAVALEKWASYVKIVRVKSTHWLLVNAQKHGCYK